ncbi:MAG TPA: M23 family metallopeptidase, partial [Caulobacteraceae bacterium]
RHVGGLVTRYAHLGAILEGVEPGLMVSMGEEIALIGNTGSSTGSHLHFEIRDDRGRPLNPELFLGHEFAGPEDLPLAAAARIPRRMRVAYVSYIPRPKRELMEAREAARDSGPAEVKVAAPGDTVRLTRAEVFEAVKVAPSGPTGMKPIRPKLVQPPPDDLDAPIVTRRPDPFGAGGDLPGWPASDG